MNNETTEQPIDLNDLIEEITTDMLDMPHVQCGSKIGRLVISNLKLHADGNVNMDIVTIDGEPNKGGYYIFWNRQLNDDGDLIKKTPAVFSYKEKKRWFSNLPCSIVKDLAILQQERDAEVEAAKEESTPAAPEGSAEYGGNGGNGGYDDYANDLPPVEANDEPPF